MNKGIRGVLLVIALAVFAFVALRAYQFYVLNQAVDGAANALTEMSERSLQQAQARQLAKQKAEDEANTMCALNNDTQTCVCRDLRNGRQVPLSFEECKARTK